jgi:hypothetical protein
MKSNFSIAFLVALSVIFLSNNAFAVSPDFAELHREELKADNDLILKKTLYVCGLVNGAYHGLNDLVAALQLVKKNNPDARQLAAQLLAVKIGLIEKPSLFRHVAREIEFCEQHPAFPLGFNDSPEGPEKISAEFYKIAQHIESLKINHQSDDLKVLEKEAKRVIFELFWTDSEKMRSMCMYMLTFIRVELKEDLPFDIFGKPAKSLQR